MPKYELNSTNLIAENERRGSARDLFWPWCGANVSLLALSYGSFFHFGKQPLLQLQEQCSLFYSLDSALWLEKNLTQQQWFSRVQLLA